MPNLATEPVRAWLEEIHPEITPDDWPSPIRAIEAPARHQNLLTEFGAELDTAAGTANWDLSESVDVLRPVLAQCGAARLLAVLHWGLQTNLPDAPHLTSLITRGDDPNARALASALGAVALRATLHRMFSPERVAELEAACVMAEETI